MNITRTDYAAAALIGPLFVAVLWYSSPFHTFPHTVRFEPSWWSGYLTWNTVLIALGFLGTFLCWLRWPFQLWASVHAKQSILTGAFWYCSLAGSAILTIYAIVNRDPVFTVGQGAQCLMALSNIWLIKKASTS